MKQNIKLVLPLLALEAASIIQAAIPDVAAHPKANAPYFLYFLGAGCVVYVISLLLGIWKKSLQESIAYKSNFIVGVIVFLTILNLLTAKTAVLPVLYFPTLDRIFGALVEERQFLWKCVLYSGRLLGWGVILGAIAGIATGIGIGFNKHVSYWVQPLIRVLGPIPSTAWIPIVLVAFPDTVSASAFLIGLAVWFPTTVMTSSGIANVQNSYFEVSATLGAGYFYRIFKVGVPAAMPHIFLGLFNGTCSSFITLMTAEMIGAKYGIGWYVNWQKEMMSYANVYAGLIVIAVLFSILMTLLFRVRERVLIWQKGVIKW